MAFLQYEYKMTIRYSDPVDKCYFTIKSFPADDFRQRSIAYDIEISPLTSYTEGQDSFGNQQIIGSEAKPHSVFEYGIKGLVETHPVSIAGGVNYSTMGMYKYPHGKCVAGESLTAFAKEIAADVAACASDKERCYKIMEAVHSRVVYEKGSTDVETTAEEAFSGGKGVCQDFAHICITLLRLFGIPTRYVCGLIVGQGESHAWIEAVCGENYIAFDPTHRTEVSEDYIKLGVGRDAGDCAINRGVMWGGGRQTQEVCVKVKKYYA